MINQWHLEPPQLIISVTGGAQRFDLKRKMQETFKRGLMNAATSTCKFLPFTNVNLKIETVFDKITCVSY